MNNVTHLNPNITDAEWQMRKDLAACFRLVDLYGWSDLLATHLSARVPGAGDQFLINPFGMMFDEITASSLVKVDEEGNEKTDSEFGINPAGFVIHSAVHMARPEVACVIHTHTQAGVGVATQEQGLLPITQQSLAVIAHSTPSTTPIALTEPAPIGKSLPHPASGLSSRTGVSGSTSCSIRSRGGILPRARCRSTYRWPPIVGTDSMSRATSAHSISICTRFWR